MKRTLLVTSSVLVLLITVTISLATSGASADSWWGDGYRNNEWVLSHGGTIIRYKIIANGASDRYKAIIYENGKVVEWENGKIGLFDDPKNSTYTIKAFKGGIEKEKTAKGGKKILSSGPIVAHPGETIQVTLNELINKVTVTSNRKVAPRVRTAPKPVEVPAQVEIDGQLSAKDTAFDSQPLGNLEIKSGETVSAARNKSIKDLLTAVTIGKIVF